jgi:hypothetical protein
MKSTEPKFFKTTENKFFISNGKGRGIRGFTHLDLGDLYLLVQKEEKIYTINQKGQFEEIPDLTSLIRVYMTDGIYKETAFPRDWTLPSFFQTKDKTEIALQTAKLLLEQVKDAGYQMDTNVYLHANSLVTWLEKDLAREKNKIPEGAENVTEKVRGMGIVRSEWFLSDGKIYSNNYLSPWNGTSWEEFKKYNSF